MPINLEFDELEKLFLKWKSKTQSKSSTEKRNDIFSNIPNRKVSIGKKKKKKLYYSLPTIRLDIYSIIRKLLEDKNVDAVYKIINEKSIDKMNDSDFNEWVSTFGDDDGWKNDELIYTVVMRSYRDYFTRNISWGIPSPEIIKEILDFADGDIILEVGAGRGLWGGLLRATSGDPSQIIVTDDGSWGYNDGFDVFTDISKVSAIEALEIFPEAKVLLSVWPDGYGEAFDLDNFRGDKLVYVGHEEIGEVTGFEYLSSEEFERDWELVKEMDVKHWTSLERLEMRFPAMFFQRKT